MSTMLLSLSCSTAPTFKQVVKPTGSLGPFYPPDPSGLPFYSATPWKTASSSDLTNRNGIKAIGPFLQVGIVVLNQKNNPVSGATVELWNVNRNAQYIVEKSAPENDPGFFGFGRSITDQNGRVEFVTVWPVGYSRYLLVNRPPHLHLRVQYKNHDDAYEINVPPFNPQIEAEGKIELELLSGELEDQR